MNEFPNAVRLVLCSLTLMAYPLDAPLAAQVKGVMTVGSQVRVQTSELTLVGDIDRLSDEELSLDLGEQDPVAVPWSSVSQLELSVVDGHHAKRGALVGFGVAGIIMIGAVAASPGGDISPGAALAFGTLSFGLPAAAIGALIGRRIPRRSWREVPIPGSGY